MTEALAEKVWDKKKDRLQSLLSELETALSLKPGAYEDLLSVCKKYTSDSNLQNRNMAVRAIGLILAALKGQDSVKEMCKDAWPVLIDKVKDQKMAEEI